MKKNITFGSRIAPFVTPKLPAAMSALGQKQTSDEHPLMSALPPKADMVQHGGNVRFVPIADCALQQKLALFDHIVGAVEQ